MVCQGVCFRDREGAARARVCVLVCVCELTASEMISPPEKIVLLESSHGYEFQLLHPLGGVIPSPLSIARTAGSRTSSPKRKALLILFFFMDFSVTLISGFLIFETFDF